MERKTDPATIVTFYRSKPIVRLDAHEIFLWIFFLSCTLLLPCPLAEEMTSFDYPDFKNFSGICLRGNASVDGTGAIQLILADYFSDSIGLAYYCEPIHLWNATTHEIANFTTTFTFGVSRNTDDDLPGGGITFFLSEDPVIPPGRGDFLGLPSVTASEGRRFVAVEFDSYEDRWEAVNGSSHVGIDISSLESVVTASLTAGSSFLPGPQGKARVAYHSISKNLSAFLDYNHTIYELSYIVDLRSQLPERVYVGFSLTTDLSEDPKNITSWSFQYSNLDAHKESPSPPSAAPVMPNSSSINNEGSSSKKKIGVLVAVIAVPLLVISVIIILCFFFCISKRPKNRDKVVGVINDKGSAHNSKRPSNFPTRSGSLGECPIEDPPIRYEHDHQNLRVYEKFEDRGPQHIPFEHLVAATDNFHESRRLGKGAFGGVYRGFMKDLNMEVAIKKLEEYSEHSEKQFAAEVKTISRLRHRNLVQLIGYCHEGHELLLVYDFMHNGSLDEHLFNSGSKVLSWVRRHSIALGVASALQYLHEGLDGCIVHRDIKPSNILLDSEFNAKLGDFGLARIANHGSTLQSTLMAGTVGYIAPEYFVTGKASKETDVYSFGIVALELACGRRIVEPRVEGSEALLHWVWELYGKHELLDAVDKKLGTDFDGHEAEQLMMVGLWCVQPEACSRPSFRQVVSALNFEVALPAPFTRPSSIAQPPYVLVSRDSSSIATAESSDCDHAGR